MTDLFISYAREDRDQAGRLAELLKQEGYDVWWDWNLVGGADFRESIQSALSAANKVIVLWSEHSTKSAFVIDEASAAKEVSKLVPIRIDGSDVPLGFGNLHTIDTRKFEEDLATIISALEGHPTPEAKIKSRPPPRNRMLRWSILVTLAAAVVLSVFIGLEFAQRPTSPTNDSMLDETEEAMIAYDAVQAMYGHVKNSNITCSNLRNFVEQMQVYRDSMLPVPADKAYSVRNPSTKPNPTIGDLVTDRVMRMKSVRKECFPN